MHNAKHVLMGSTRSSAKEVSNKLTVSGLTIEAGLCVILESTDKISLDTSEGAKHGISLGKDLSDTGRTAVCRKGLGVPLKLKAGFNPVIGTQVFIEDDTGLGIATGGGADAVNAVYASARLDVGVSELGGIAEGASTDTATVGVAYIDFPGGL